MVNQTPDARSRHLDQISSLVRVYLVVVVATVAALAVLSTIAPRQAPLEAWVHAVVVAIFAVVLPLRARSAIRGSVRAWRAVGPIAAALLLTNVVEAMIPGAFPVWMRIEMTAVAVLMGAVVLLVVGARVSRPTEVSGDR